MKGIHHMDLSLILFEIDLFTVEELGLVTLDDVRSTTTEFSKR